jgi:hypothetical protein
MQLTKADILATIDELNQYLNGNVTSNSLRNTLIELARDLE